MKREGGYTLVEAALAIAISASLVLLTVGLTTMVGNQRFRSTMVSTQSFVQSQYSEVRDSINSRQKLNLVSTKSCNGGKSVAGNNDTCYIFGRFVYFYREKMASTYIWGFPNDPDNWPDTQYTGWENIAGVIKNAATGEKVSGTGVNLVVWTGDTYDASFNPVEKDYGNGNIAVVAWVIEKGSDGTYSKHATYDVKEYSSSNAQKTTALIALLRSPTDGSIMAATGVQTGFIRVQSSREFVVLIKNESSGYSSGVLCISGSDSISDISVNFNAGLDVNNLNNNTAEQIHNACTNVE